MRLALLLLLLTAGAIINVESTCSEGQPGAKGDRGETGLQGTPGLNGINGTSVVGPAGPTGATGAAGRNGTVGATGATGATGAAGATGATGAQGLQGVPGRDGSNGTNGAAGATGAAGVPGRDGLNGTNGAAGATGPQGPAGAAAICVNGTNGRDGVNGTTGAQGVAGAAGAAGRDGVNGTNGVDGAAGAQGPRGFNGTKGDKGDKGNAAANYARNESGLFTVWRGATEVVFTIRFHRISNMIVVHVFPASAFEVTPEIAAAHSVQLTCGDIDSVFEETTADCIPFDYLPPYPGATLNTPIFLQDAMVSRSILIRFSSTGTITLADPVGTETPVLIDGEHPQLDQNDPLFFTWFADDNGTPVERGPAGPVGPEGPQGEVGEDGGDGPQGPQGPTGAQGIQGVQGVPGTHYSEIVATRMAWHNDPDPSHQGTFMVLNYKRFGPVVTVFIESYGDILTTADDEAMDQIPFTCTHWNFTSNLYPEFADATTDSCVPEEFRAQYTGALVQPIRLHDEIGGGGSNWFDLYLRYDGSMWLKRSMATGEPTTIVAEDWIHSSTSFIQFFSYIL